jgi:hypothetical protein
MARISQSAAVDSRWSEVTKDAPVSVPLSPALWRIKQCERGKLQHSWNFDLSDEMLCCRKRVFRRETFSLASHTIFDHIDTGTHAACFRTEHAF